MSGRFLLVCCLFESGADKDGDLGTGRIGSDTRNSFHTRFSLAFTNRTSYDVAPDTTYSI